MKIKELKQKVEQKIMKSKVEQKINETKTFVRDNKETIVAIGIGVLGGALCYEVGYSAGFTEGLKKGLSLGWATCTTAVEGMIKAATNA